VTYVPGLFNEVLNCFDSIAPSDRIILLVNNEWEIMWKQAAVTKKKRNSPGGTEENYGNILRK
jgi:hypothetical protein